MRLFIILLVCLPLFASAQEGLHGFYANGKAGFSNWVGDDAAIALSFEAGLLTQKTLFALAYTRTEEIEVREVIHFMDATIGKYKRKNAFVFHYQAGLGTVWGKRERGDDDPFVTVGLPIKTGIKFVPPNFFSLGLDFQANLNTEKSCYMLMFTVGVWPHVNKP